MLPELCRLGTQDDGQVDHRHDDEGKAEDAHPAVGRRGCGQRTERLGEAERQQECQGKEEVEIAAGELIETAQGGPEAVLPVGNGEDVAGERRHAIGALKHREQIGRYDRQRDHGAYRCLGVQQVSPEIPIGQRRRQQRQGKQREGVFAQQPEAEEYPEDGIGDGAAIGVDAKEGVKSAGIHGGGQHRVAVIRHRVPGDELHRQGGERRQQRQRPLAQNPAGGQVKEQVHEKHRRELHRRHRLEGGAKHLPGGDHQPGIERRVAHPVSPLQG